MFQRGFERNFPTNNIVAFMQHRVNAAKRPEKSKVPGTVIRTLAKREVILRSYRSRLHCLVSLGSLPGHAGVVARTQVSALSAVAPCRCNHCNDAQVVAGRRGREPCNDFLGHATLAFYTAKRLMRNMLMGNLHHEHDRRLLPHAPHFRNRLIRSKLRTALSHVVFP
jgi:hypothetical protein